ncbi:MAG: phenylalanine--tRNA ligase subunit beta [Planctomycetota bacterium]|nr:phenylalanine--tRNA ligase subunit beta [Planctomycetota bacterium]
MIVSWEWLKEYVDLGMSHDELVEKLTMSGLNHEGSMQFVENDTSIDLEVTSNRPDCLGHIGVAREIAVLFGNELRVPETKLDETGPSIEELISVDLDCSDLCHRFTARLIRGVKVGPSPDWLIKRLQAVFKDYKPINNIADITNYVMMESGQPLHAFDYQKIDGQQVVIRRAGKQEEFEAINHQTYKLDETMCVIANAEKAMAIGGVMGGAESEVSENTVDVLIESAEFSQMSIRSTARSLKLHSPASHRFERPIDPAGTEYASERCCQLILEIAGGELAKGVIDAGSTSYRGNDVQLRQAQLKRILGIEIPGEIVPEILKSLGCQLVTSDDETVTVRPPSWRRDLSRECDLVEEVGRIYGFDKIPENADVPMAATVKRNEDRVVNKARSLMTGAGFDEAMTASLVLKQWSELFSPWSCQEALEAIQPMLGVVDSRWQDKGMVKYLRKSLVPSLLEARRYNEHRGGVEAELFEIANIYLGDSSGLPKEPTKIAFVGSRDYCQMKGVIEALFNEMNPQTQVEFDFCEEKLVNRSRSAVVKLAGTVIGFVGEVSNFGKEATGLRKDCSIAELDMQAFYDVAELTPLHQVVSDKPTITRDFNFVVDESVRWSQLYGSVASSAGEYFESAHYVETFRNPDKDGPDKKRVLLSVVLRGQESTLTGEQAEAACQSIVETCRENHRAELVAS